MGEVNKRIAVWLGWKWNTPNKRQMWDPYWTDETGNSVYPSRTFFDDSDGAAIGLLHVLVARGYVNTELGYHNMRWWFRTQRIGCDEPIYHATATTISRAIVDTVDKLITAEIQKGKP